MIGSRIRVEIDGVITVDQADVRLSHPGIPWSDRGVIGLQNSHGAGIGTTEFRRIKIINLAP